MKFKPFIAILITVALYILFFRQALDAENFFWGSDAEAKQYPTREFLYRSLITEGKIPLYTERVLFGLATYQDIEHAYLNPVNVLSIWLAGPVVSFKLVHFFSILAGSFALYKFLERKGYNLVAYTGASLVYFYSFFHLNHLIHFDLIAVSLLLPLNILLLDYYIETGKKKYTILQGLVLGYGLLWGHPQTTLLVLLALTIYTLVMKANLKHLIFATLISISIALPQIVPSFKAYMSSARNIDKITATQGSLTPELTLTYVFPYLYSTFTYYYGEDVDIDFSYTETYNYIGIVATVIGILYILFGKKDKFFWFYYFSLLAFLILGYLKYFPFLPIEKLPVVSAFRYWDRAVFMMSFGLALIVAKFLNFEDIKFSKPTKQSLKLLAIPLLYLILMSVTNLGDPTIKSVQNSLINYRFDLLQKREILIWFALPSVALLLIFMRTRLQNKRTWNYALQLALAILLLADFRYFAYDVLDYRIGKWSAESGLTFPFYYNGKRVIDDKVLIQGMKPLLRDVYTPYGLTQFVEDKYIKFFTDHSLGKSVRASFTKDYARPELDFNKLKEYGITYVRTRKMEYVLRNPASSSFLRDELPSEYEILKDGHIKMKVDSPTNELYTTIKYDQNWNIKVNGQQVKPDKWEDLFMKFPVEKGENTIEFKYIPYDIYVGIVLGLVLLSATNVVLFLQKDRSAAA